MFSTAWPRSLFETRRLHCILDFVVKVITPAIARFLLILLLVPNHAFAAGEMCEVSLTGVAEIDSLFETRVEPGFVSSYLPERLNAFAEKNPTVSIRIKKHILLNPTVASVIRGPLTNSYQTIYEAPSNAMVSMLEVHSDSAPKKYNYVVLGDKLMVMKINAGKKYISWLMTKHIVISQYSDDVRMAGEMWKTPDGKLHFNLSSGTFKPSLQLVPVVADMFKELFKGVAVEGDEKY